MLRKNEEIKKDDTKKSTIADRCACVLWRDLLCMMIGSIVLQGCGQLKARKWCFNMNTTKVSMHDEKRNSKDFNYLLLIWKANVWLSGQQITLTRTLYFFTRILL